MSLNRRSFFGSVLGIVTGCNILPSTLIAEPHSYKREKSILGNFRRFVKIPLSSEQELLKYSSILVIDNEEIKGPQVRAISRNNELDVTFNFGNFRVDTDMTVEGIGIVDSENYILKYAKFHSIIKCQKGDTLKLTYSAYFGYEQFDPNFTLKGKLDY